jgi:transposase-like protein
VITGRQRRRRWTAEEKARIVAESLEANANISDVARRHGVARGLLTVAACSSRRRSIAGDRWPRRARPREPVRRADRTAPPAHRKVLISRFVPIRCFRDWETEKQRYELKPVGTGVVACMLKPSARGQEPPHWLCPNCFEDGKKSYFQFSTHAGWGSVYRCKGCDGHMITPNVPEWL